MALDPSTLNTGTPRTLDGRRYPEHLRTYESLDQQLLPIADGFGHFTFDALSRAISNPKTRSVLPQWLSSAEWRGLVERRDASMHGPREYEVTARGRDVLRHAS